MCLGAGAQQISELDGDVEWGPGVLDLLDLGALFLEFVDVLGEELFLRLQGRCSVRARWIVHDVTHVLKAEPESRQPLDPDQIDDVHDGEQAVVPGGSLRFGQEADALVVAQGAWGEADHAGGFLDREIHPCAPFSVVAAVRSLSVEAQSRELRGEGVRSC